MEVSQLTDKASKFTVSRLRRHSGALFSDIKQGSNISSKWEVQAQIDRFAPGNDAEFQPAGWPLQ
jgi:hypothetical protein